MTEEEYENYYNNEKRLGYEDQESKSNISSKIKKIVQSEVFVNASIVSVISGLMIGGTIIGLSIQRKNFKENGYKTPYNYKTYSIVRYDGEEYKLNNLYKLSSDNKTHICYKESRFHYGYRWGWSQFDIGKYKYEYGYIDDPDAYVDIKTKEDITFSGEEEKDGYTVEKVIDYFPYEEYATYEKVVISQEQIDALSEDKGKTF